MTEVLTLDQQSRLQGFNARASKSIADGVPGMAIPVLEEALTIARPAWLLNNYGDALARCARLPEAIRAFEEAMAVDPHYPDAPYNLGVIYNQQAEEHLETRDENLKLARAAYRRSLECRVKAVAENNLANVEMYLCDFAASEAHYRAAVKHRYDAVQWNLSLNLMMQGRWREAWDLYEFRPQRAALDESGNIWRGESLKDRSILVNMEQGLGDNVFALRYLAPMVAAGARVSVACDAAMTRLVQTLANVQVFEIGAAQQSVMVDFAVMAMSLPGYLSPDGTGPSSAYLTLPSVPRGEFFRVGLCWNGSTYLGPPGERNVPLNLLAPLADIEGVQFVSLQKGGGVDEIEDCGFHVERSAIENCRDVYDTAMLMNSLDLIITIDTLIPHLAGALGKPCWLLNRWASCWQWGPPPEAIFSPIDLPGINRVGTSPRDPILYDSVQIFRQMTRGDWTLPLEQVRYGLAYTMSTMREAAE